MDRDKLPFGTKLSHIQNELDSFVCVGLDPDPDKMPAHLLSAFSLPEAISRFLVEIIEATAPYASAYKLNFAFFEALGANAHSTLQKTLDAIPSDRITIADAKRGDIGNTARFYAASVFDGMNFDAITLSPYMGKDSVTPFLDYAGTASFVLVRTSNESSTDLQLQQTGDEYIYERVARLSMGWMDDHPGDVGFVVGAPDVDALRKLRTLYPRVPFLIPGVGAQGGNPAAVVKAAATDHGRIVVNSSRAILYASSGKDFASRAAEEAARLRDALTSSR